MSKKAATIKTTLKAKDIKYMLEQVVQIHHRMILAKQAFEFRADMELEEGMDLDDLGDSPEEVLVDLILEDLDKIFIELGIDVPEPKSLEERIAEMVPKELTSMKIHDMDELREACHASGLVLYDYLDEGRDCPN